MTVHYLGTLATVGGSSLNPSVLRFAASKVRYVDAVYIIGLYDSLGRPSGMAGKTLGRAVRRRADRHVDPHRSEPCGKAAVPSPLRPEAHQGRTRIVVNSRIERDDAIRFGVPAECLTVRRNGVDLARFGPSPNGAFRDRIGVPPGEPLDPLDRAHRTEEEPRATSGCGAGDD